MEKANVPETRTNGGAGRAMRQKPLAPPCQGPALRRKRYQGPGIGDGQLYVNLGPG
jgi:hypothetical protein